MKDFFLLAADVFYWIGTHLVELSTFFVAAASFWVSWLSYKRDSGRLDLYIGVGEIIDRKTGKKDFDALNIKIVNSGRRPMTATGVYGFCKWQHLKRFSQAILGHRVPKCLRPTGFWLEHTLLTTALMPNREYRTLNEGESIQVVIPGDEGMKLAGYIARKAESVYVSDSLDRKHFLSRKSLSKIRYDVNDR